MWQDKLWTVQTSSPSPLHTAPHPEWLYHSLQEGRYNWRHDQTLRAIASGLAPYVEEANTRKGPTSEFNNFFLTIAFRTADGTTYRNPVLSLSKTEAKDILKKTSDWIFLMDEEHCIPSTNCRDC